MNQHDTITLARYWEVRARSSADFEKQIAYRARARQLRENAK
jgi:hypothetical protein